MAIISMAGRFSPLGPLGISTPRLLGGKHMVICAEMRVGGDMDPRLLGSYAGIFLILAGVALIAVQMIFGGIDPALLLDLNPFHQAKVQTNVVGFGVVVVGVFLLLLSAVGRKKPPV